LSLVPYRSRGIALAPGAMGKVDNKLRQIPKPTDPDPQARPGLEGFWAKVTGYSAGVYQWMRQYWDASSSSWTNQPGAVAGTNLIEGHGQGIAVGSTVRIAPGAASSSGQLMMMAVATGTPLYLVHLTLDGGTTGDASSSPTYTYKTPTDAVSAKEIKRADGSPSTGLYPTWGRPVGDFDPATLGLLYVASDGDPVLLFCNEIERPC